MAQIEKSTIIKLRQNEASAPLINNGEFRITLSEPILMEEGDQMRVHTAILDSSAPGIINVPEELDIEIDVGRYIRYNENFAIPAGGPAGNTGTATSDIMALYGVPYLPNGTYADQAVDPRRIAAVETTKADQNIYFAGMMNTFGEGVYTIYTVEFRKIDHAIPGSPLGGCTVHFRYTNPLTGLETTTPVIVPQRNQFAKTVIANVAVKVVGNANSASFTLVEDYTYTSKYYMQSSNIIYAWSPEIPSSNVDLHAQPYTETLKFKLPARKYLPGELCSIINLQLSAISQDFRTIENQNTQIDPTKFVVDSPFLATVRQMESKINALPKRGQAQGHSLAFFSGNDDDLPVKSYLLIDSAKLTLAQNDLLVGAEEVALTYDPVLSKISFSIMHFPIYVSTSGDGAGTTADTFAPGITWENGKITPDYAGAIITGMRPAAFWGEQLGFLNNIGIPKSSPIPFKQYPAMAALPAGTDPNEAARVKIPSGGNNIFPFKMKGQVGINITSAFLGLDVPVQKNANYFATNSVIANQFVNTLTGLTTPIWSDRTFTSSPNDEGYFLIEINYKFRQKMVGGKGGSHSNNIQCITGKYYIGANNFLQDQGSGSIDYQHLGEPELITDISVRILNSNGTIPPPTDLGPINSIFLELTKTVNVPTPTPSKK